jgi:hypothetical protein
MNEPLCPKPRTRESITASHIVRSSQAIVRDLCIVLQQQMDALTAHGFGDNFSQKELSAYRLREKRLCKLRSELGDYKLWTS